MNLYQTLKHYFGYDTLRPGQQDLMEGILNGSDVLGIMPTGAGKSLCYQVPALMLPGITIVISPLISLMSDQVKALNQAGVHAAYINSSLTENQIRAALLYAAQGQYKIIYALTEAGKVLYARSGSILKMLDVTKREVVKASQSATIHIGITPSTVLMMLEYIERFSKQYPGIHFDIHEGSTFNLKEQLEKHMIDITTLRTPITLNGCKTKRLIREKLAAVAADGYEGIEGFRKKDGSQISLRELSKEHLILSHRYRNYIISAFEAVGLTCDIYYECEDARTALTIAEKGIGVAILPESMRVSDSMSVYGITDADLTTEILLAWREERLPAEVEAFIKEMEFEED